MDAACWTKQMTDGRLTELMDGGIDGGEGRGADTAEPSDALRRKAFRVSKPSGC